MTDRRPSPAQQAILDAMAGGAALRFAIHGGSWCYVLDGHPVDGRTVNALFQRELVTWSDLYSDRIELTPRGRERAGP